jgi:hypothetical protein
METAQAPFNFFTVSYLTRIGNSSAIYASNILIRQAIGPGAILFLRIPGGHSSPGPHRQDSRRI